MNNVIYMIVCYPLRSSDKNVDFGKMIPKPKVLETLTIVTYCSPFQHWIANNLFGMAFAVNGVELLHLNNVVTGCILLGGLFIYDIFWVFGTNVMVTVAKSFEAPIKCKSARPIHRMIY